MLASLQGEVSGRLRGGSIVSRHTDRTMRPNGRQINRYADFRITTVWE
jgi:hypothetical protein